LRKYWLPSRGGGGKSFQMRGVVVKLDWEVQDAQRKAEYEVKTASREKSARVRGKTFKANSL